MVFLTPANIEQVLLGCTWPHSAWDLANLYLGSMGAPLLGPDAPKIVGLSEETTCYVSLAYFHEEASTITGALHTSPRNRNSAPRCPKDRPG